MDHQIVLDHIAVCTSRAELAALQAAIEDRTRALTAMSAAEAAAPPAKRARSSSPSQAATAALDIPALARAPVSKADVAGKSEIRLLLNVRTAFALSRTWQLHVAAVSARVTLFFS